VQEEGEPASCLRSPSDRLAGAGLSGSSARAIAPARTTRAGGSQTGPVSAARLITATEREQPQSGHELSRAQEWCSASQLAHRYERCRRTSLLMLTLDL
jgi:hypothetical protein